MKIGYKILPNRYFGGAFSFDTESLPSTFVAYAPPPTGVGEYAKWGIGGWKITNTPPPILTLATEPPKFGWYKAREFLREFNRGDRKTILESTDNIVQDSMRLLNINGLIDFSDPDMQQFMDQLVTLNIISNNKKNRIYEGARFTEVP